MGVRDMIDEARKAGCDTLGLFHDPEAVAAIGQMLGKKVLHDHIFASYMTIRDCMRSILEHYDALQAPPTPDQTADYIKAIRDTLALCGDLLSVPPAAVPTGPLDPDELGILGFLREYGATSVEHLAKTAYQDPTDIVRYLSGLLKRSLVRQNAEGKYELTAE